MDNLRNLRLFSNPDGKTNLRFSFNFNYQHRTLSERSVERICALNLIRMDCGFDLSANLHYLCIMHKTLLILTGTLCILAGCRGNRSGESGQTDGFDQPIYSPRYASGFEILGAPGRASSLIVVRNSWQGADSISSSLFISRDGELPPDGFQGAVIHDEARRIAVMSSSHIALLHAIGESDRVVGASGVKYLSTPVDRKSIVDIGYEGNINYEALIGADPDLVLLYGIYGASPAEPKIRELGIPYIYIGDYLEESPLGKAEWIVPLAEIAGRRQKGIDTFSPIPERYNTLRDSVTRASLPVPSVMLNTPYADSWFMPPTNSYMARLITDAGAEYIYKDNDTGSSLPIDMETAYILTSRADFWINIGSPETLSQLRAACPKFADTRPVTSGQVYNNTLRSNSAGGNDFYESAIVNPDLILRDLIKIFHPDLINDGFVYYKRLL